MEPWNCVRSVIMEGFLRISHIEKTKAMAKTKERHLEDYMAVAVDTVKEFVRNDVRSGRNDRAACMDAAHKSVRDLYKRRHGDPSGARFIFRKESMDDLAGIFASIDSDLAEYISKRYMDSSRRQKAEQVGKVTAKGILEPALASYGLKFNATYQRYRAKVEVFLDGGTSACFYVPYKKLQDDVLLERIPEAVEALNTMISDFGKCFEVSKRRKVW